MKLWLLRPIDPDADDGPWDPWPECCFGYVIRAETEAEARSYANADGGDETNKNIKACFPWLDEKLSSCIVLDYEGVAGIIIKDFHAG